jgi:ATPase family associated with various cellular activities (AAA)
MTIKSLAPEWKRIELLCMILQNSRQGQKPTEQHLAELSELQAAVMATRATGVWDFLGLDHPSDLALDIVAVVAASEVSYAASFSYTALGQDNQSPDPSLRLVQALLSIQPEDQAALHLELLPHGALICRGLVTVESKTQGLYLRCGRSLKALLFGKGQLEPPPGAREVFRDVSWNDLILAPDVVAMLRNFVGVIRNRTIVEETWGGARRGGPIALFSGASGTGKTLAASVIATALDMPLYRIDLGQLVSKYIGETEKNLNALFDSVNGSRSILLFDESDALFGKRGNVQNAQDRYANMAVSHLLTRIELHDSPCILTTNLRISIDAGFLRRFHFIVDFSLPDADQRLRLWHRHLPPLAPRAIDLDLDQVAQTLRFTGAAIENAALHAAYQAAERGKAIGMVDIAEGAWNELLKDGTRRNRADLGALEQYLNRPQHDDKQTDPQATA